MINFGTFIGNESINKSNILNSFFIKGGVGSGIKNHHTDNGHNLADEILKHESELRSLISKNSTIIHQMKVKNYRDEHYEKMEKDLQKNKSKISELKSKIKSIESNYNSNIESDNID